jgi:hypothetical protein
MTIEITKGSDNPVTKFFSNTPETDAALYPMNGVDIVWPEFARELERERDEARQQLRIAVGLLSTQPQFADKHPEDVLDFVKEGAK